MWDQISEPDDAAFRFHVDAVVRLAVGSPARCGRIRVVAIDGRSGAGKTTLASAVAAALATHGTVGLVHLDRIYPGWDGLAETPDILATHVLQPLSQASTAGPARGATGSGAPRVAEGGLGGSTGGGAPRGAAYPVWDWEQRRWNGTVDVEPADFLVVEGCGSSVGPARPYAAGRVFVDADRALRRVRGLARDGQAYAPHWERWAAQEDALFEADGTKERADLVIDTTG